MEFGRTVNLLKLLKKKSFFLFGPRGVGKSYLIRSTLSEKAFVINLLKTAMQLRLQQNPSELEEIIKADAKGAEIIVIDEIQKIPVLLDEVHRLIEEQQIKFLLTGSSARQLKSGGVNLLGGRARIANLFPLTYMEIGEKNFNLDTYLRYGSLPAVWNSDEPEEELDAYVQTYITQEIKAEGAVRKIPAFVNFLQAAALSNGQLLNYANVARDGGVSPPTIASYYEILEDTLIGFQVQPFKKKTSRKSVSTAKFYFFDPGIVNTIIGTRFVDRNSNLFGELFEQFIALELRAFIEYHRIKMPLQFWRTEDKKEVDFIIGDELAIEVKSTKKTNASHLRGLKSLQAEGIIKSYFLVSQDPVERLTDGILCLPWQSFLGRLWNREFL
jgi:predicted AAA+ superfamily ATPase